MLVFEGSTLTFDVPEIHRTMNYNPVLRYSHLPTHPATWETVTVELVRVDGPADPSGKCAGADDGPIPIQLPAGQRSQEIPMPFCLENGQRYQVKLTFSQYDPSQPTQANIYIDSVSRLFLKFFVMIPKVINHPLNCLKTSNIGKPASRQFLV